MFELALDRHQREVARQVLARAGAPFDPRDRARFHAEVERVWSMYQAARAASPPPLPHGIAWAEDRIDRAIYARDREEHIDDPKLPEEVRRGLIRALDRLNVAVGFYPLLFHVLKRHLRDTPPGPVSVLDVGSGHGAFPIRLQRRGRLDQHTLRVVGSDLAPAYVDEARTSAARAGVDVEFRVVDALRLDELDERFDVITCTQTVHHFPPALVADLMYRALRNARRGVVLFDARRGLLTLGGVVTAAVLTGGPNARFVHDGVVSIRRMYSPAELELLARCAPGGEAFAARNVGPQYVVAEAHA